LSLAVAGLFLWPVLPRWACAGQDLQGVGVLRLNDGMPISHEVLKQYIHQSGFNADERLRAQALEIIWNGIQLFRENKILRFRSNKDKLIKKTLAVSSNRIRKLNSNKSNLIVKC
jgi:hypothetical protein